MLLKIKKEQIDFLPLSIGDRVTEPVPELSVIVPCFNEEANIPSLVRRIDSALSGFDGKFEIILIDDASRDNTWLRIQEAQKEFPFVRSVRHETNRGIVEGWWSGLQAARSERLVTIDADMQYRPEDIVRLVETMNGTGADFVQGWRETQAKRGLLRRALTAALSAALNLLFGMNLKDNKSGFVLYKRASLEKILSFRKRYRYFQHFIAIAAGHVGCRIEQIPVVFDERSAGSSFISHPLRFSLNAMLDLPRALREFRPAQSANAKGRN
jgi:phenylacetate-CoA ligase